MTVFIVSVPGNFPNPENVIAIARDREAVKRKVQHILKGNPDTYIVDPITKSPGTTVFLLDYTAP